MSADGRILGHDEDGQPISLRAGRFGPYVQKGEATTEAPKPPRASLPKGWSPASLSLEQALRLLALPREVGVHPESGKVIMAGLGRYGPYLLHDGKYAKLTGTADIFDLGMNAAVVKLAEAASGAGASR